MSASVDHVVLSARAHHLTTYVFFSELFVLEHREIGCVFVTFGLRCFPQSVITKDRFD